MKILAVFGTRPEAIKMCPLVLELKNRPGADTVVCLTGQHREMLRQVMDVFDIREDVNLDIMQEKQSLSDITNAVISGMKRVLSEISPDVVLVHGDTTTSFAAALAAFYEQIPVGHVEAGLRTGNRYSPFPEEMNRLLTDRISTYYFAPTRLNEDNLHREGITEHVYRTGNTVIDAFAYTVKGAYRFHENILNSIDTVGGRSVLITAHRRENLGVPLKQICMAIRELAFLYKNVEFIYPVHPNPAVKGTVYELLDGIPNIRLLPPLDVLDMHNLMSRCTLVMTDSGGLQEEAPHFGKPVLVLRTETERPEAVEAGTVLVTGTDRETIVRAAIRLLDDDEAYRKMALAINPYGDGHASERIADILISEL